MFLQLEKRLGYDLTRKIWQFLMDLYLINLLKGTGDDELIAATDLYYVTYNGLVFISTVLPNVPANSRDLHKFICSNEYINQHNRVKGDLQYRIQYRNDVQTFEVETINDDDDDDDFFVSRFTIE